MSIQFKYLVVVITCGLIYIFITTGCLAVKQESHITTPSVSQTASPVRSITSAPFLSNIDETKTDLIAFVGIYKQTKSIAIMTSDGQNIKFLTNELGDDYYPQWSPDGKRIIFLSNRGLSDGQDYRHDLWSFNLEDENLTQLTKEGTVRNSPFTTFVLSSDGNRIIHSFEPVQMLNLQHSKTESLGLRLEKPISWSPDGKQIALVGLTEETFGGTPGRFLAIITPEGESLINKETYGIATINSLAWSPDSQTLAIGTYFSLRGEGDLRFVSISQDRDISIEVRLSDSFDLVKKESINDVAWSPDGKKIAFRLTTSALLTRSLANFGYIYITDSNLVDTLPITSENLLCNNPQWSPDSAKLVFACQGENENTDIWIVDRDASNLRRLTNTPTYEGEPVWQPK